MTLKVLLKKYKSNGEIEFSPVNFNLTTKIVINHKLNLKKAFPEILYRTDNWINEGSGWIVQFIESQYINISTYRLINIKNNDQKCFLWCHVRHINPLKIHPERIAKEDKELVSDRDYDEIEFPVREKDFSKIEKKNNICINVFCYESKLTFPIHLSDQKFENSMDSLDIINGDKLHYVYAKDFNRFMFHKRKNKNKKYFCKSCLQCFSSKNVLARHKEDCLSINSTQSVRLEK